MKRITCSTVLVLIALALLLAAPAYAQGEGAYVVRPGDTLTHIAARHGLTATQLAAANGLRWDAWVYAGQQLTIPAPASEPGGTAPAPTGGVHVVQRGDSLTTIARRYGVTVDRLAAANNLGPSAWVYAGQRLTIPGAAQGAGGTTPGTSGTTPAPAGTYIVRPGDTLLRIAMRHGLTVQRLAMANGMHVNAWVYIGQRLTIPAPASEPGGTGVEGAPAAAAGTYVVRPGDSLIGIAVRHGVSVSQLASVNGLNATAWVYVGQRLQIPGPGSTQANPQPANPQPANPQPANPPSSEGIKWIDINLTAQTLTAYVGDQAVLHTRVSTGTRYTPTVVGTYSINRKYLSTHMSGPGYSVPNVPHVMFFHGGYSIHGTYWHSNFGTPMSHGCVNLPLAEAKWLYEWAPVGTRVVTHY